jgi:hypothetical protein
MRLVKLVFKVALAVVWCIADMSGASFGQPAKPGLQKPSLTDPVLPPPDTLSPGDVILHKQGKVFKGWITERGSIGVGNDHGRTIYSGAATRMGSIELQDLMTGEFYTGRVNPMGEGQLLNPQAGDGIRIEIKR